MEVSCAECGSDHAPAEEHQYVYVKLEDVDSEFIDGITTQPIVDCVHLPCEHVFSRRTLATWVAQHGTCPSCRRQTGISDFAASPRFVRNLLYEILV